MEYPTFKLEGIVKAPKNSLEDFEGPLALILQLLQKNKIEIKDIQISLLLDQYLDYLKQMEDMNLEIASEFVAMASHLVYIKTKMLLNSDEEVSEYDELISSLETLKAKNVYTAIKNTTEIFSEMYKQGAGYITKQPEPIENAGEYKYFHEKEDIINTLLSVLKKDESFDAPVKNAIFSTMPQRIVYPVSNKSEEIIKVLKTNGKTVLFDMFEKCESLSELVATFLSILELCKNGNVELCGEDTDKLTVKLINENYEAGETDNDE